MRATALVDDVRSMYCNTVFILVLYEFIDLYLKNENHTFNHICTWWGTDCKRWPQHTSPTIIGLLAFVIHTVYSTVKRALIRRHFGNLGPLFFLVLAI